jgi:uncharacterized membrane protein YesL
MILFMVKKAFFDMWDNLFAIILMNLGFILLVAIPILIPSVLVNVNLVLSIVSFVIGILLLFVFSGGVALATRDLADYKAVGFADVWAFIKQSWKHSLALGAMNIVLIAVLMVAFPVYSGMKHVLGFAAMVILFWFTIIWLLSSQYFFPLFSRLDTNIPKIIKKCFILFFDNTGFTVYMGIVAVVVFVVSGFTAFLIPGIATVILWTQVGFKLRLLKYDFLEQNPETRRKDIPWDAILVEERERVGKRSLKGMIFPWKE